MVLGGQQMPALHILDVNNVSKKIKRKAIVDNITFHIDAGEIHGFLGPNGAGKSTTMRMIVGLSKPTAGTIEICGHSITNDFHKAMLNVGCIIETPDLYGYLSGMENLEMLRNMSPGLSHSDVISAVELVGMENRISDKVSTYSLGMKQRLGLAQALMHHPKLLVLDEPMNGLDPQGIYTFRSIIKRLAKEENTSVLISSHLISEVQSLCDSITIINAGRIIKTKWLEDLMSTGEIVWKINDLIKGKDFLQTHFGIFAQIVKDTLVATVDIAQLEAINSSLHNHGFIIKYVFSREKSLESLFLDLTAHQKIT